MKPTAGHNASHKLGEFTGLLQLPLVTEQKNQDHTKLGPTQNLPFKLNI
jgi:hypothetical protein